MFASSLKLSANQPLLEGTIICNYATFLFRNMRKPDEARQMFILGLKRFPTHKGLRRNLKHVNKEFPAPSPGSGRRVQRTEVVI